MVAINKFVLLAVVASVLVSAAYAADESASAQESVGNIRSFGRKIVDGGSSILSHIPIVNRFFGNSEKTPAAPATDDKPAPAEVKPTEEQPAEEEQATEEKPATEEPAVEEPAQTDAPAAEEKTPEEAPAQEEEAKSEEPAQSQ